MTATTEDQTAERTVQGAPNVDDLPLRPSLEAVLMIADQPLDHLSLAQAVGAPPADVEQALHALAEEYAEQGRASTCATPVVVGASTPVRSSRRSSSSSWSTANRRG